MTNYRLLTLLLFFWGINLEDAHAYINPGSGSDFFQIIMSSLVAIGAFGKRLLRTIIGIFGLKSKKINDEDKYE